MKRYIMAAFAAFAMAACTKTTPDCNTDNNFGIDPTFRGERVELDVESTKVTLDGTAYAFEAGDEIIAQSSKGAVAVLTNTAENPNHFSGTFSDFLLEDGEEFSFYFNCGQPNGSVFSPVYRQEGKPWLRASQKDAHRNEDGNYGLSASFNSPDGMICLAIGSDYDCTADFTMHMAYLPIVGGNSIQGLEIKAGRPAFINVSKHLGGGFYLTVHKGSEVMYCNYASSSTISENSIFTLPAFTAFGLSGSISGFDTTYDIYTKDGADAANAKASDWMDKGTVSVNIEGISSKLFTFKSLSVTVGETETTITDANALTWNGNKSFSVALPESTGHSIGEKPVKAVLTMETPDGEISKELSATRHITGLPYIKPINKENQNDWSISGTSKWENSYIQMGQNGAGESTLTKTFHIPSPVNVFVSSKFNVNSGLITTTFSLKISGTQVISETAPRYKKLDLSPNNIEAVMTNGEISAKNSYNAGQSYTQLYYIHLEYR